MDNLNDLKAIWQTAKTDILPNHEAIVQMGKKFRNQKIRRKITVMSIAFFNIVLMIVVMFVYDAKLLITYLGELLVIAASIVLIATNIKSIKRFYDMEDYNNHDLILFLERTKQNQLLFYKKTQVLAMVLTSSGVLLYLYEMLQKGRLLLWGYGFMITYLAIMWFIVRPRIFKKQHRKIDEMILQLEKISKQFENEN